MAVGTNSQLTHDASRNPDTDPEETREWLEALEAVIGAEGV